MKRRPTGSDVFLAESRLVQSRRESRESFLQVRSAIRLRLAQPSSLLIVTGLGALLGIWFARRSKPRVRQDRVSAWLPIFGVVSTYLIRFGMQRLAETWIRARASDPGHDGTDNPQHRGTHHPATR